MYIYIYKIQLTLFGILVFVPASGMILILLYMTAPSNASEERKKLRIRYISGDVAEVGSLHNNI